VTAVGERNAYGLTAWDRYRILTTYRTIAMVGLSSNYYNASSFAGIYLDDNGNGFVVLEGTDSCAEGTSLIEADLEESPFTTETATFTVEAPRPERLSEAG